MIVHDIQAAASILRAGGLVAFPTETVYGLGADALSASAVAGVYGAKGRPSRNPLIVHVSSIDMARTLASHWPGDADTLARAFWPGPLTIVVPKAERVPTIVTGGGPTIALRMPDHPVALALIEALGGPIVGPSANASGSVSPTVAAHVAESLGETIAVLDGGPCQRGIESTVVRIETVGVSILRLGVIGRADLERFVRVVDAPAPEVGSPLPAPGMLERHYAPRTPVKLVDSSEIARALREQPGAALLSITPGNRPRTIDMSHEAGTYAQRLYAALREADAMGAPVILVESPTGIGPIWDAVRDRLARASTPE